VVTGQCNHTGNLQSTKHAKEITEKAQVNVYATKDVSKPPCDTKHLQTKAEKLKQKMSFN